MKKASIIVPLVAAILSITFIYAGEKRQAVYASSSDLGEVESIARDYIEGWYTGDVARMARALHDDLVKRMPVHEGSPETTRLHAVSKARMLELTAEGGGENPDAIFEIVIDDVSRDIATARVASPEYLDYLQLAKTSSGWKIVNVLFHTHD
jgi:hypothetical protein